MTKWGLRKRPKTDSPVQKTNKNILELTYLVAGVFLCMVVYLGHSLQVESENVINNTYNTRLDSFANRVVWGRIFSNDGTVPAETLVDSDGNETRSYPYGPLFAHVVGYFTRGKTEIEALSNFYLLISHMNLVEQVVNELSGGGNLGDHVVTILDVSLQQTASDALGGRRGAVVMMEPDTGKAPVMISWPEYNPDTLIGDWDALTADGNTSAQLVNRATQGSYPSSSTFKLVTALKYIREHSDDYMSYEFDCDGYYQQGEYTIKCYYETVHGRQDLKPAFANSHNGAFANLELQLGLNRLKEMTEGLLFNQGLPLMIAYNRSSYFMEAGTDTWEVLQTLIGQGVAQMTPMLGAMLVSPIANDDTLMKPYFLDHAEDVGGEMIRKFMPVVYGQLMMVQGSAILSDMMREVVTVGTGSAVRADVCAVAGKTGSAEFDVKKETHGWFLGFAPAKDPKLMVNVIAEEDGSGDKTVVPVVKTVFGAYSSR